ncbi:MAG: helix-turn-helix transcriptional regulator [Candidatus Methanoperedens sp.]|nr:helix-turn-helix transcriptional regulator [Candidatus Methanoperedens sp.]
MVSKYKIPKNEKIEKAVHCLSEKGSIEILHCLEEGGTLRFNEIKQRLAGISPRTLAKRLKQLEGIKLINRRAYAEIPPRVEYSLTERGGKLASILNEIWKMLEEWYL